jgi:hypothetical protein
MIWGLLEVFTKVRNQQKTHADDSIDKLNRSVTVILLIMTSLFVFSKSFGAQIVCLDDVIKVTPISLDYVHAVCLTRDVNIVDGDFFSEKWRTRTTHVRMSSYAWIPLIVLAFALLFYLPYLCWKRMVRQNNYQHVPIDVSSVIDILMKSPNYKPDDFNKNVTMVAAYMDRCFTLNNYEAGTDIDDIEFKAARRPRKFAERSKPFTKNQPKVQIYFPLVARYIMVKLLYLGASVAVFFLADFLLQFNSPNNYYMFGPRMFAKYTSQNTNESQILTSMYWPVHILCTIKTRGDHKNFVDNQFHCNLPANVFNEKVFLILWCWFVVLVALNVYSLLEWTFKLMFRRTIVANMLEWPFRPNHSSHGLINSFVHDYLSSEGFLMLMLIKSNAKDWHCRSLIKELWTLYMRGEESRAAEDEMLTPLYDNSKKPFLHGGSTLVKQNRRDILAAGANADSFSPDATPRKINIEINECNNSYKENVKLENIP